MPQTHTNTALDAPDDTQESIGECDKPQDERQDDVGQQLQQQAPIKGADGRQARENKLKQWQEKQARLQQAQLKEEEQQAWIDRNAHYCTRVSLEHVSNVQRTRTDQEACSMDSLLRPYIDLKDDPKSLFIAEGTETVRLLIQHSDAVTVKSIFVKPATLFRPARPAVDRH